MLNAQTIQYPFSTSDLKMRAYYTAGDLTYLGYARPGVAEDATGWQIRKLTYSSGDVVKVEFASSTNDFDKIMDDYAGYVYG